MTQHSPELVLSGNQPRAIDERQDAPAIWDALTIQSGSIPAKKSVYFASGKDQRPLFAINCSDTDATD